MNVSMKTCAMVSLLAIFTAISTVMAAGKTEDDKLGLTTGGSGAWGFYRAANPAPGLPRVLLIGDSIVNGYRNVVIRELKGKANVDVWLTPAAENNPDLLGDLKKVLAQGPYDVVHFNIGLHGWPKGRIPEGQYEPIMRKYVETMRAHAGKAKLIWASSTPITEKSKPTELDAVNNPTIVERNGVAARIMKDNGITVNDLYALVSGRLSLAAGDKFHWKAPAYELMGKQVAALVGGDLSKQKTEVTGPDLVKQSFQVEGCSAFYKELVEKRGMSKKVSLLARSRGGLQLYNWAVENPGAVVCVAAIFPVCNLASYPGLDKACGAYGLTEAVLERQPGARAQ